MVLTEREEVDKIEVIEKYKVVQVRCALIIEKDGVEISRSFHRHVLHPGDDLENENPTVQAICNAVWTNS
jgi:hypothetical protein